MGEKRREPRTDRNGRLLAPSMAGFVLRQPWLWNRFTWLRKWTVENWTKPYVRAEGPPGTKENFRPSLDSLEDPPPIPFVHEHDKRTEVNALALAEAISSEDVKTGKHHILLDIDHEARLWPSSSRGCYHLYVQLGGPGPDGTSGGVEWEKMERFLLAAAEVGLIEEGYAKVSIRRRATFVRLPWIRKGHEVEDRQRAMGQWIEREGDELRGTPTELPF